MSLRLYGFVIAASLWLLLAVYGAAVYGAILLPVCILGCISYVRRTREALQQRHRERQD